MRTFKNNNRRSRYRSNDRNYKRNGEGQKFNSEFSPSSNFQRRFPGKNNHNAPKLIEKYNDLAREASSNGDKILSENYLQHADHFQRVLNEKENFKKEKYLENKVEENADISDETVVLDEAQTENQNIEELESKESKNKKIVKSTAETN